MLGTLEQPQIETLLSRQVTGHLGCHADGVTYVVPVNYVYKDGVIYIHSAPGKKVEMMRHNPEVCFEVDEIDTIFNWRSVIAWGRYEEIIDIDEQQQAMQLLIHRIMPMIEGPTGHPSHGFTENDSDLGVKVDVVIYKIIITHATGRFEQS